MTLVLSKLILCTSVLPATELLHDRDPDLRAERDLIAELDKLETGGKLDRVGMTEEAGIDLTDTTGRFHRT